MAFVHMTFAAVPSLGSIQLNGYDETSMEEIVEEARAAGAHIKEHLPGFFARINHGPYLLLVYPNEQARLDHLQAVRGLPPSSPLTLKETPR